MSRELLIGAGHDRKKKVRFAEIGGEFDQLVTLDMQGNADVIHDLNVLPYPFAENEFNEIHAYEVLEHCGRQGDWRFFFAQFAEFWRILKNKGYLCATVPMWDSPWAWGDPGHTRTLPKEALAFLDQDHYKQVGKTTATDYRAFYKADFKVIGVNETQHQLAFVLQAHK